MGNKSKKRSRVFGGIGKGYLFHIVFNVNHSTAFTKSGKTVGKNLLGFYTLMLSLLDFCIAFILLGSQEKALNLRTHCVRAGDKRHK